MNDLNKYGILIADIIKEVFILLLALVILLNFSIQLNNNNNIFELKQYDNGSDCDITHYDFENYNIFNFFKCNVNKGLMDTSQNINILKNTNSLYVLYIFSMYFFIALIYTINVNNKLSWKYVYNDFVNKLTYVFIFPFMVITTISFFFMGLYIISQIIKLSTLYRIEYIIGIIFLLLFIYGYIIFLIILTVYSIVFVYSRNNIKYIVNANRYKNSNKGKQQFLETYKNEKYYGVFNKGELSELYDNCISDGKNSYLNIVNTVYTIIGGLSQHYKLLNNSENKNSIFYIVFNYIVLFLFSIFMIFMLVGGLYKVIGLYIYNMLAIPYNLSHIFNKLWCADHDMKIMHRLIKFIIGGLIVYNIYHLFSLVYFVFSLIVFIIMLALLFKKYNNIEIEPCSNIIL